MTLQELATFYLKEKGLDGFVSDDECACALADLMPCGQPNPNCRAVKLTSFNRGEDCKDSECEWNGEDHWHEKKEPQ